MNRRESLGALALIALASPASAQPAAATKLAGAEHIHTSETMEAGSVSLETSRVAISKSSAPGVKRFAQAESAEQETVASVLKTHAGLDEKTKPPMTAEGKAAIDRLHAVKTGPEFDKAYVAAQIEGHQHLLRIQETYLTNGKDATSRAIAMLARGHIKEHLMYLETLQKELA